MDDIFSASSGVPLDEAGLKEIASHSASRFLDNGLDLNDTIAHEAVDRGLSLEQIKRVIEMTNQLVYGHYLAAGQPKTEFPLADLGTIAPHVFPDLGGEDEDDEEYSLPPHGDVLEDPEARAASVLEPEEEKCAAVQDPLEKLAELRDSRREVDEICARADIEQQLVLDVLYKEACRLVADGTPLNEQLYAAATCFPSSADDLQRLFSKIGQRMWADDLLPERPKVAIVTVRHANLTPVVVSQEPGGEGSPLIKLISRSIDLERTLEKATWGRGILDQKIQMHMRKAPPPAPEKK